MARATGRLDESREDEWACAALDAGDGTLEEDAQARWLRLLGHRGRMQLGPYLANYFVYIYNIYIYISILYLKHQFQRSSCPSQLFQINRCTPIDGQMVARHGPDAHGLQL
jgi:hypothetical protein